MGVFRREILLKDVKSQNDGETVDPQSNTDSPTGSGNYKVKMRLDQHIPQFLPISDKKI